MLKQLQSQNQLNIYYLLEILLSIGGTFTHTTYYIYLTTNLGLSNSQAMFLDTVLFIGILFFEIPTGVIGDRFGRKLSFIVARILLGISCLIYFLTGTYALLVMGSIVFALGMAFQSGAFEAWIIDQIPLERRRSIFVNRDVIRKLSVIFVPILSVFIAEQTSYGFPYLISFVFSIITALIGYIFMNENKGDIKRHDSVKRGLERFISIDFSAISVVVTKSTLRYLFVSVFLSALAMIAVNSYSSKLIELMLDSKFIGIIVSAGSLISILASLALNKLQILDKVYLYFGLLGAMSLVLIGIVSNPFWIVVFFLIQVTALALFGIQMQTLINNNIEKNRATTLSTFSFIASVSGVVGTLVFGYLADSFSINATFSIAGVLIFLSTIPLLNRRELT